MNSTDAPRLVHIETVSEGWINKYLLTYRLPDGTDYQYESVSRKKPSAYRRELEANARGENPSPDAVSIVPVLPDGSIILIREFRYPINSWCIAFPAGLVEPGEKLASCVERELREEAGCKLRQLGEAAVKPLPQTGYSSTGLTEENVQVVFAAVEFDGRAAPEQGEFIEIFTLPHNEIEHFLATNKMPIGTRCQLVLEMLSRTLPADLV